MKTVSLSLKVACVFACVAGVLLLCVNIYGLTQPIRKPGLGLDDHSQLRFVPQKVVSFEDSVKAIANLANNESTTQLALEANRVTHESLVHIDWERVDTDEYRQTIPIWENYFLYALGKLSGLPQFKRYHYSNYLRNIKRGIGICGDASTTLSSILDLHQVANKIVSFQGHVIVEFTDDQGNNWLLDPDFGVPLGVTLEELIDNPEQVRPVYAAAGYSESELDFLLKIYYRNYTLYDDTYHFMTGRYIFEELSYFFKWILPIVLMLPLLILKRNDLFKSQPKTNNGV